MDREHVVQRLRAWTTGTDPATGAPLPLSHALRHADVHATLAAALALLDAAPAAPRPRNAGRAWSSEDDRRLAQRFDEGLPIARLAEQLERTRGSITARLVKLGKLEPPAGIRLRT